jgi:hypothetical protein
MWNSRLAIADIDRSGEGCDAGRVTIVANAIRAKKKAGRSLDESGQSALTAAGIFR